MESSAIARKRVFSGSSSSFAEPEVIEIAPPLADRRLKLQSKGKQKEAAYHEIIDVDIDDDYNDVVLLEGNVESNKKLKRSMGISFGPLEFNKKLKRRMGISIRPLESNKMLKRSMGISIGPRSPETTDLKKVALSKKGKEISGHHPKGFNPGSNSFFDLDDYVFNDDYSALQSRFDRIGIPAGIEAPFPWLTESVQKDNPAIPFVTLNARSVANASQLNRADPWLSSGNKNTVVGGHSTYFDPNQVPSQTVHFNFTPIDRGNYISTNSNTQAGNDLKRDIRLSKAESSLGMSKLVDVHVQKKYESFKKFDTVVDYSDHFYYLNPSSSAKQPPKNWAKQIQNEWKILEKDLPDTIFVRAYESRMDLLRAVIIGAEGTPYHDGLFFFDVCFPSNYPNSPPLVRYHSGGLRINPNLYNCGKVCLSLLNTWTGGHQERWLPHTSTILQVLVSIQGLVLNMKPYFNEPGFARSSGSVIGEQSSLNYNENTLILSLKTMVYTMNKPPKNFEDLVIGHFQHRVRDILMACKAYTEGVQVGCLVKGGVQDVDEGSNSCSPTFRSNVASYVKTLVAAFKKIGAKEANSPTFRSNVASYVKTLVAAFKKIGAKEAIDFVSLNV